MEASTITIGETTIGAADVATVAAWARDFASDCEWADCDAEDIAAMSDARMIRLAARHYAGGVAAMVADAMADRRADDERRTYELESHGTFVVTDDLRAAASVGAFLAAPIPPRDSEAYELGREDAANGRPMMSRAEWCGANGRYANTSAARWAHVYYVKGFESTIGRVRAAVAVCDFIERMSNAIMDARVLAVRDAANVRREQRRTADAPRDRGAYGVRVDVACARAAHVAARDFTLSGDVEQDANVARDILADMLASSVPAFLARVARMRHSHHPFYDGRDVLDILAADVANVEQRREVCIAGAASAAAWRGHTLAPWRRDGARAVTECTQCGAYAMADAAPLPNGIGVSGSAVAINCTAHAD